MKTFKETIDEIGFKAAVDKCGIPHATLHRIRSGNGNPTLENLLKISRGLGIPMDKLAEELEPKVSD